jgi:hypothetical protein
MTSSRITPITAAGDGESTAGRQPTQREHGLAVLRHDEAKGLISLACGAMSETHSVGHEMHTLIYSTDGEFRPGRVGRPVDRGAGLLGSRRPLPADGR